MNNTIYNKEKSIAELLVGQLTKEKFHILGKITDATIGAHIEGTKAMTPEESKQWHETHAYYDKDGHFIISPDPRSHRKDYPRSRHTAA